MTTPEERLRADDPFQASPYEHGDFESMLSRITSASSATPARRAHSLRVRMVGVGVSLAVVAAGAVATIDSTLSNTPSPVVAGPVLTFSEPPVAAPPTVPNGAAYGTAQGGPTYAEAVKSIRYLPSGHYQFSSGPGLSSTPGAAVGYRLEVPANGPLEAARVARILHTHGAPVPVRPSGASLQWTVGVPPHPVVGYEVVGGIPYFSYNVGGDHPNTASSLGPVLPSSLTGHRAMDNAARLLLRRLQYRYELADPRYGYAWTSPRPAGCGEACTVTHAWYAAGVGGVTTRTSIHITFDRHGRIVSATGPALAGVEAAQFPVRSAAAAVTELGHALPQPSGFASAWNQAGPMGPVIRVRVTSSQLTLELYRTADGSLWLLPTYSYEGSFAYHGHTIIISPPALTVLALDRALVHVAGHAAGTAKRKI